MSHGLRELGDDYLRDPHGVYRALRAEGPAVQVVMPNGIRMWLITRYDDAREALADPRLRKDAATIRDAVHRAATTPDARVQPAELASHMLNSDPPDHTRLRRLVSKAFTPRAIERLRPRIEEITAGLLDRMDGDVDLIETFAYPLPMTVICELLGVPASDRDGLRALIKEVMTRPFRTGDHPEERDRRIARVVERFVALIDEKRAHPADDILTALVQARDQEDRLDDVELVSTCFLLFLAGHETTVNLIGNATLALLTHPDQRIELLKNPGVIENAVEEFLRYDGPLNFAPQRVTGEDVTIGGVTIPKGSWSPSPSRRPTGTPRRSGSPTGSTSTARSRPTWPSGTGSTTASGAAGAAGGADRAGTAVRAVPGDEPGRAGRRARLAAAAAAARPRPPTGTPPARRQGEVAAR